MYPPLQFLRPVRCDGFTTGQADALAVALQRRTLIVEVEQRIEFSHATGIEPVYDNGKRIKVLR